MSKKAKITAEDADLTRVAGSSSGNDVGATVGVRVAHGNVEAVAYMEEPDWVVFCVLSARNQEQFEKAVPALKELVSSYHYLTNQVQIQK